MKKMILFAGLGLLTTAGVTAAVLSNGKKKVADESSAKKECPYKKACTPKPECVKKTACF